MADRARAKRRAKKAGVPPAGVVGQVTELATGAAHTLGEVVKSAAGVITGTVSHAPNRG